MGKYISNRKTHDRSQTDCWTQIVSKYEERTSENLKSAVKSDTVHRSSHTELTNTEVHIASFVAVRSQNRKAFQVSHCGAFKVSRSTKKLRNSFYQTVKCITGSYASRKRFVRGSVLRKLCVPVSWKFAGNS
ncbi:hypothetical protein D3C81_988100 [compost metagenome]